MSRAIALHRPPPPATPTTPGLVLCTCEHERRAHDRHGCRQRVPGLARLANGPGGPRRCPCVRYVEASFERQQIPLFDTTTKAR